MERRQRRSHFVLRLQTIGLAIDSAGTGQRTRCVFRQSAAFHVVLLNSGTEVANDWIDRTFREMNAGRRVDLPAAVGLCMCIRRDCLRDVGVFDADAFGQGYGEENGSCMRAAQRGWRRVLSDPAKPYRFAVLARSMRTSRKLVILTVNHALGGGLAPYLK